jgi:CRISPR-associated protein Cmr6
MRVPDDSFKDGTKVDLVHRAETGANYGSRLQNMNARTQLIAGEGNTFEVTCPWRIRVGGSKGPESMLLPAFDHLGIPYIPSSTLRGVARTQAIKEVMEQHNLSFQEADKAVAPYFGHLDAGTQDQAGKVVFLDAYPMPTRPKKQGDPDHSKSGGLAVDITNNIWSWEEDSLKYSPNPNVFFSLKQATFLIGIRKGSGCTDEILAKVKNWLIAGVGSQINSGYGRLVAANTAINLSEFLRLDFELKGQLIHGRQTVSWREDKNRYENKSLAEVRPVAFKNMLRYWFRVFGLGILPANQVQEWEGKLFGSITPTPNHGWIRVEILNGEVLQPEPRSNRDGQQDPLGKQKGTLLLSFSGECPADQRDLVKKLFHSLTWLMFHLGGVGQGARRPCYSRKTRDRAPWYRGSSLYLKNLKTQDSFWTLPKKAEEFKTVCQERIRTIFAVMRTLSKQQINESKLQTVRDPSNVWAEAVDSHCKIIVCSGENEDDKPYALYYLHEHFHQLEEKGKKTEAKNLCGGTTSDQIPINDRQVKRGAIPSPVWIANHSNYQVVTLFGAEDYPRKSYLKTLLADATTKFQIWPMY